MNILYVTTISSTMIFFTRHIQMLQSMGHTVELACNLDQPLPERVERLGCHTFHIPFSRAPLDRGNFAAYGELKKLLDQRHYDIVHTHTPNASALVRLACRKLRKAGLQVLYTAHGFHFYKDAPLKNWLLYYPVEKLCSYFTDMLITINEEDYALAQRKMKAKKVVYVPGVGIDLNQFEDSKADRAEKRAELGIPQDATLLLSVGELSRRKNHETALRAVAETDAYYCIAGQGDLRGHLQSVIDSLGMTSRVKLLGYRKDVKELCQAADIFVLPSYQEGLPVALMEAMASGLPCAASRIRGNTDLIDEEGGVLFDPHSVAECKQAIERLLKSDLCAMGKHNTQRIQRFSVEHVNDCMRELYCGISLSEDSENDGFKGRPIS